MLKNNISKTYFSLPYLTLPGIHPVDQIYIAKQCGFDGVGLRTLSQGWPSDRTNSLTCKDMFIAVQRALSETQMILFDIELGRVTDNVDVSSYEEDFARGAELGARFVTASVWTDNITFAQQQFERMAQFASKYGMDLSLEFVPFSSIKSLKEALMWIQSLEASNVCVLIDLLHLYRSGYDNTILESIPENRMGCIHLCDGPGFIPPINHPDMIGVTRARRLYLGDGEIPVGEILSILKIPPYYAIELPNEDFIKEKGLIGHAKKCLETTKLYLRKLYSGVKDGSVQR